MTKGPTAALGHLLAAGGRGGDGPTDGELLTRFLARRDEAALAALVRRHAPMVWGVCRRLLTHHHAEDAFQATFLVLVRRAAAVRDREAVASWLYGVARRTAAKLRAREARRAAREGPAADVPEPIVAGAGAGGDDRLAFLDEEVGRLPARHRAVVVLCDLDGKTRAAAARELGLPEGTVGSRLARARATLARRLARRGVTLPAGVLAATPVWGVAGGVPTPMVSSTIEVARLSAAGRATAAGAVSPAVAALTHEVLRAMLLTRLKLTAGLLLGAALAVGAGAAYRTQAAMPPAPKAADRGKPPGADKGGLQGTWRLVRSELDGVTLGEGRPEITDTRLVIDGASVTMTGRLVHSPAVKKDPEDVTGAGTLTLDPAKSPKQVVFTWATNPWVGKEYLVQRGIYEADGDTLKLCFYFPGEDTKGLVPTEFSAGYGSKRSLGTWVRVPPPGAGGTKPDAAGPQPGTPAAGGGARPDRDRLQGAWQVVEMAVRGKGLQKVPADQAGRLRAVFTGDELEWRGFKLTYTLDPSRTPKQMDWVSKDEGRVRAIYELDGDALKVCLTNPGEDRPTEFKSVDGPPGPEGKAKVLVFGRVKGKAVK